MVKILTMPFEFGPAFKRGFFSGPFFLAALACGSISRLVLVVIVKIKGN